MIDGEFEINKVIGMGGSSKVFLAHTSEGHKVAIKAIRKDKKYTKSAASSILKREFEMLQKLEAHPNIIKSLGGNFDGEVKLKSESENIMYNVLEYAHHGALSKFVRYTGGLEEEIARLYIMQIADATQFIHGLGYAHLDIKLENILLDKFFNIKVADLGSCTNIADKNGFTRVRRGTLLYMAPEVAALKSKQEFDARSADIYSLGVTIYLLLTGEFPDTQELKNSSLTCASERRDTLDTEMEENYKMKDAFSTLSEEVKLLIQQMLNPDPFDRPSISEVLQNSWLTKPFSSDILEDVFNEMNYRKKYIVEY